MFEIKEFTIFFKNGNIMEIDAYDFYWFNDSIDFFLTKEDYENKENISTTFMSQYIYAVSESKYIHYDKNTLLPVEANVINKTQDLIDQYNELFVKSNIGIRRDNV